MYCVSFELWASCIVSIVITLNVAFMLIHTAHSYHIDLFDKDICWKWQNALWLWTCNFSNEPIQIQIMIMVVKVDKKPFYINVRQSFFYEREDGKKCHTEINFWWAFGVQCLIIDSILCNKYVMKPETSAFDDRLCCTIYYGRMPYRRYWFGRIQFGISKKCDAPRTNKHHKMKWNESFFGVAILWFQRSHL